MSIKRIFYIFLFMVLGFLLQLLLHAGLEIWYSGLLLSDFARFGLGFSWKTWFLIHTIGSVIFLFVGIAAGFWQGKYWWKRIYGNKKMAKY